MTAPSVPTPPGPAAPTEPSRTATPGYAAIRNEIAHRVATCLLSGVGSDGRGAVVAAWDLLERGWYGTLQSAGLPASRRRSRLHRKLPTAPPQHHQDPVGGDPAWCGPGCV